MPVQINEIVVRATINASANNGGDTNCAPENTTPGGLSEAANDEIAEIVLEILKFKKER